MENDTPKNEKGIDTMTNKTTKKDNYNTLLSIPAVAENAELKAFIEHELELLARKAEARSDKPTKSQLENAAIAERIPSLLTPNKYYRLGEIKAMIPELAESSGTQRIAIICKNLEAEGVLTKTVEKRVVYYSLAD